MCFHRHTYQFITVGNAFGNCYNHVGMDIFCILFDFKELCNDLLDSRFSHWVGSDHEHIFFLQNCFISLKWSFLS